MPLLTHIEPSMFEERCYEHIDNVVIWIAPIMKSVSQCSIRASFEMLNQLSACDVSNGQATCRY